MPAAKKKVASKSEEPKPIQIPDEESLRKKLQELDQEFGKANESEKQLEEQLRQVQNYKQQVIGKFTAIQELLGEDQVLQV